MAIANRGRAATPLKLHPACAEVLAGMGVHVALPADGVVLKPREQYDLRLSYKPTSRAQPFLQDLVVDAGGARACSYFRSA